MDTTAARNQQGLLTRTISGGGKKMTSAVATEMKVRPFDIEGEAKDGREAGS
jgi:hypothetical protein